MKPNERHGYRGQCDRCEHRGDEFPTCNQVGLYDLEQTEAGDRPPEATEATLADGRKVRAWRDDPNGRCPLFEAIGRAAIKRGNAIGAE